MSKFFNKRNGTKLLEMEGEFIFHLYSFVLSYFWTQGVEERSLFEKHAYILKVVLWRI